MLIGISRTMPFSFNSIIEINSDFVNCVWLVSFRMTNLWLIPLNDSTEMHSDINFVIGYYDMRDQDKIEVKNIFSHQTILLVINVNS